MGNGEAKQSAHNGFALYACPDFGVQKRVPFPLFCMLGNCYKMGIGVTCKYVHKKALGYSTAREQQEKNKII
ncbi:MAG: hypothetical protein FWC89_10570, partial [Defluviitaleaceae bacterium]|nr:hypothetical protein [Defluviitaleaceae bacterium]